MSVIYQPSNKDQYGIGKPDIHFKGEASPDMVKKSTMYIIVALSVVLTAIMFASTATVVYLIANGSEKAVDRSDHSHTGAVGQPDYDHAHSDGNTDDIDGNANSAGQSIGVTQSQSPATTAGQSVGDGQGQSPVNSPGQSMSSSVTIFTRWGRKECTNTSEVLYTGYTVGSRYNHHGGTSTVLCLPKEPQWKSIYAGQSGSYLYGSEYQARNTNLVGVFGKGINEQDVPCAVCEVTGRGTMMMIPARTECFNEWNKEYSGYLMSSNEAHNKAMDIVCMDEDPEVVDGQAANNNGALFYFVEANGQLPYPPYAKGSELTCVVCTK